MFHTARIKLTLWYLLSIMLISLMFSSFIYQGAMSELHRFEHMQQVRVQRRIQEDPTFIPEPQLQKVQQQMLTNEELVEETEHRILWGLLIINGGILAIATVVGYFLAGKTLQPIQTMMDEQNRFISDASHELKTPLTSLKSAMEVYLRGKKPSITEAKTLIAESIEEVNKLQTLSESLLQLAQYEQPNGRTHFETVPLKDVIQKAVKKVLLIAKKNDISIEQDIDEVLVHGDMQGLIDVFVILFDNAIKYSPSKSTISVQAKKIDGHVRITVQDEGCGIADDDIAHIFDRFYRADASRTKGRKDGYGLGLSIAKKIVDAHRGTINVKSKLEKGTTFQIILPQ